MPRRADFVIIGAMKCATSTLRAQLAQQPGLYMSEREANFFSNDDICARGVGWYESQFDGAHADQICGESSTHYTKLPTYPRTAERMVECLPHAQLIYVMRHPVDRLVSQYIHEWSERIIDVPIEQAIEQRPELVAYSRYAMQLEPFLKSYGQEKILPVFFDQLRRRPQRELERICRFVGYAGPVRWYEQPPWNVSSARMRKSRLRDAVVEFSPLVKLRRMLVPKSIRTRIRQLWTMRERPQISEIRLRQLVEVFDEDLARVGQWLGLELSCENFRNVTAGALLGPDWAKNLHIG